MNSSQETEDEISSKAIDYSWKSPRYKWIHACRSYQRKICKRSIDKYHKSKHWSVWQEWNDERCVAFSTIDHWQTSWCKDVQWRWAMSTKRPFDSMKKENNWTIYIKYHRIMMKVNFVVEYWQLNEQDEWQRMWDWFDWSNSSRINNDQSHSEDMDDDEEWRKKRDYWSNPRRKEEKWREREEWPLFHFDQNEDPKKIIDQEWKKRIWYWIDIDLPNNMKDKDKENLWSVEDFLSNKDLQHDNENIDRIGHRKENIPLEYDSSNKYKDKHHHENTFSSSGKYQIWWYSMGDDSKIHSKIRLNIWTELSFWPGEKLFQMVTSIDWRDL